MLNNSFSNYPDVVTPKEIQDMLRIGRNAVYELLKSGEIKSLRIGKKYIVPKSSVIKYLQTGG